MDKGRESRACADQADIPRGGEPGRAPPPATAGERPSLAAGLLLGAGHKGSEPLQRRAPQRVLPQIRGWPAPGAGAHDDERAATAATRFPVCLTNPACDGQHSWALIPADAGHIWHTPKTACACNCSKAMRGLPQAKKVYILLIRTDELPHPNAAQSSFVGL